MPREISSETLAIPYPHNAGAQRKNAAKTAGHICLNKSKCLATDRNSHDQVSPNSKMPLLFMYWFVASSLLARLWQTVHQKSHLPRRSVLHVWTSHLHSMHKLNPATGDLSQHSSGTCCCLSLPVLTL